MEIEKASKAVTATVTQPTLTSSSTGTCTSLHSKCSTGMPSAPEPKATDGARSLCSLTMKRCQQAAHDDYVWEGSDRGIQEHDLETWFRQIGLRKSDASRALQICETHYIHTLSDLRQICAKGELNELFGHPFLPSRIEAELRIADSCDDDVAMIGIETKKPIHIKHDGTTISCDVTPSTTVRQIKDYICSSTCFGYPVQSQQIVFNGRQLADDKTVGLYQIGPYSCLYLIASKKPSW